MDGDFLERTREGVERLRTACAAAGITPTGDDRIREAEAADLLDVSLRTLQRWRETGSGPTPTRIGGRWFYTLAALAAHSLLCTGHESSARWYSAPKTRQTTTKHDSESRRKTAR